MPTPSRKRFPIAILTDFGYRDHYVGAMKGVIASIAPDAPMVDITHGIAAQSITAGAIALRECWRYFPKRTVFLAVVDPGVGTARRPLAIETRAGARLVGPDNGLLWPAAEQAGIARVVELRAERYRLRKVSATFHGRDIFAPAAAHLWNGVSASRLGPAVTEIERLQAFGDLVEGGRYLRGEVIYVDGFGNLVTNIDCSSYARLASRFHGCRLFVRIGKSAPIEMYKAYGDAPSSAPLATFGSFEMLEVAVRDGNAAERLGAGAGAKVTIRVGEK